MSHSMLIFVIIIITITITIIIQSLFLFNYFIDICVQNFVSNKKPIKLCIISSSKVFDSISVLKISQNSPRKVCVDAQIFINFLAVGLRSTKNESQPRYFLIFRRFTFRNFQKNYFIEHL